MPAEALLRGTDALTRATAELGRRGNKWLVRYRDPEGYVRRLEVKDPAEADRVFWAWVEELRLAQRKAAGW